MRGHIHHRQAVQLGVDGRGAGYSHLGSRLHQQMRQWYQTGICGPGEESRRPGQQFRPSQAQTTGQERGDRRGDLQQPAPTCTRCSWRVRIRGPGGVAISLQSLPLRPLPPHPDQQQACHAAEQQAVAKRRCTLQQGQWPADQQQAGECSPAPAQRQVATVAP